MLAEVENWDLRDHRQQATRRHGRLLASHASGSCWTRPCKLSTISHLTESTWSNLKFPIGNAIKTRYQG
jgi:hypothetical protein